MVGGDYISDPAAVNRNHPNQLMLLSVNGGCPNRYVNPDIRPDG